MSEILIAAAALMLVGGGVYIASRGRSAGAPSAQPVRNFFDEQLAALDDLFSITPSQGAGFDRQPDPAPTRQPDTGFVPGGGVLDPDPEPDPFAAYKNLTRDQDILARTLWGEARGEGTRGMHAVANVIMNRVNDPNRWPNSAAEVCLQPWQFSMWNEGEPNRAKALAVNYLNRQFRDAVDIAKRAVAGQLPDITGGANHYHTKAVDPSWNRKMRRTAEIGAHIFMVG
jgi:spore germination cell wall hydrolase CwlJ-like protein